MKKIIAIILYALLTFFTTNIFAAKEKNINSLTGSNIKPFIAAQNGPLYSLTIEDQRYMQMISDPNWSCRFGNKQSNVSVVLRFDEAKRNFENSNWTLNVTYNIKLYGTSTTPYTTYTGEVATIDFKSSSNTSYNDIFFKSYEGALKAELTITAVSWNSGTSIPVNTYDGDIYFDLTQETERFYNLANNGYNCIPGIIPAPVVVTNISATTLNQSLLNNNQFPISWNFVSGAESYDLEWLFVDSGTDINYTSSYDLDFTKATRINISHQNYNIPMSYPNGILIYRVRAVGISHVAPYIKRIEGPWSADGLNTLSLTSPNLSSFRKNYVGLDPLYNWQYSAAYAEDGKSKEVISYFDGSLRNRQTVTVLNSDNNAVIAETKYDFQGRPVVQILPTPLANSGIKYYSNFNANFSKQQFDINSNFPTATATMPNTSGAGNFYANNNAATGIDALTPDAQGYPYTQTKFKTDGTGRVSEQSGVGLDHKLGSGHSTRYVYGTPGGQTELDRLFGNEVGNVAHYKKNLTVDANGQGSISYLDQEGRTIATALAVNPGTNLLDIDNKPASTLIETDMLTGKNITDGETKISTTVFVVSKPSSTYTLSYSLNYPGPEIACYSYLLDPLNVTCNICDNCVYDLDIKVTDELGNNVPISSSNMQSTPYAGGVPCTPDNSGGANTFIQCRQITSAQGTFIVTFPNIGSYTVDKTVRINQKGIDNALAHFDQAVKTAPCGPLTAPQLPQPCNDCEYICNKQYGVNAPTYVTPSSPIVTTDAFGALLTTLTLEEQEQAIFEYSRCYNVCTNIAVVNVPTECELKAELLQGDMSPGGQYFDNLIDQINTCSPQSNCNPNNPLYNQSACINNWLTANLDGSTFWDEFETFITSSSPANCVPLITLPNNPATWQNWAWVRANWKPCFAVFLMKYHPEYCSYNFYCNNWVLCNSENEIPVLDETAPGVFGNMTVNSITMDNVKLYDKAFKLDNALLFADPVAYSSNGNTTDSYKSDLESSPNLITSTTINEYKDPLFFSDGGPEKIYCPITIKCSDESTTVTIFDFIKNKLSNFYTASINGGSGTIPMSIWYVLDDPDDISSQTAPFYPSGSSYIPSGTLIDQETIDFFVNYRSVINNSNPATTKYAIFRNYYLGQKEFVLYALYKTSFECRRAATLTSSYNPNSFLTSDAVDKGYTSCASVLPHAQIRYQNNTIFDLMLNDCPNFNIEGYEILQGNLITENCITNCASKADVVWMPEIIAKIEACNISGLTSASVTVLSNIRHDLIEICTKSCDMKYYQGLDYVDSNTPNLNLISGQNTFNGVIQYFLSQAPYNSCTNLISSITVNNPIPNALPPYSQASCICDNIKTFAIGNDIVWDLSDPDLPAIIATAINNEMSLDYLVSTSDVCAWMSQCFQGSGSCLASEAPPLDINVLLVPIGSGVTTHSVPATFVCPSTNVVPEPDPCDMQQANDDVNYQNNVAEAQEVEKLRKTFLQNYINSCLGILDTKETMTAKYELNEYYYTLYYYDQAGNLIKTVPPEGVRPLAVSNTPMAGSGPDYNTANVKSYRLGSSPNFVWPLHTLVTNYKYNTLNQIREQVTPDAGITKFYYDVVGRLVVSQNAKQGAVGVNKYSYTFYDDLSRITEVGELTNNTALTQAVSKVPASLTTWTNTAYNKSQITRTYYDEAPKIGSTLLVSNKTKGLYASGMMGYLRNRVACVTYAESDALTNPIYRNASHYSYDIHGNVKTLYIENTDLGRNTTFDYDLNKIDYNYDLISGKVNEVHFNTGKADQFHHQYYYDADNRITATYTSRNGKIWEKEAKYFYYKHGPLARTEIGDKQVQATDYAYTIHGWIKGVNSNSLDRTKDIGLDGNVATNNLNQVFAQDAYGYSLGYYNGDYVSKKATASSFLASQASINNILYPTAPGATTQGAGLYNGNIANMTTNSYFTTLGLGYGTSSPIIKSFRYDQLNRIRNAVSYDGLNTGTNTWNSATSFGNKYAEEFHYDLNGNITTLKRYDNVGTTPIDDLTYGYYKKQLSSSYPGTGNLTNYLWNNKLYFVGDIGSSGTTDLQDQTNQTWGTGNPDVAAGLNYNYDEIGNLVKDQQEQIASIAWTVYGKIDSITRITGSTKPDLKFRYDASGNRISKLVKVKNQSNGALDPSNYKTTYYIRDAQGNVMATYEKRNISGTDNLFLVEQHIYGSSRLGMLKKAVQLQLNNNTSILHQNYFSTTSTNGWGAVTSNAAASVDATSQRLKVDVATGAVGGSGVDYTPTPNLAAGKTYEYNFDIDLGTLGSTEFEAVVLDYQLGIYSALAAYKPVQGSNTIRFTSRGGSTTLKFQNKNTTTQPYTFYLDNVVVKEIDKQRSLGDKAYELSNHLGNVIAVVSDRKIGVSTNGTTLAYYSSEIKSANDYYSFGGAMKGRNYPPIGSANPYRYGFNGKENDNETVGTGQGTQNYGDRIYNPALGRFLSVDPLTKSYPMLTPYQFASNRPIDGVDLDGREFIHYTVTSIQNGRVTGIQKVDETHSTWVHAAFHRIFGINFEAFKVYTLNYNGTNYMFTNFQDMFTSINNLDPKKTPTYEGLTALFNMTDAAGGIMAATMAKKMASTSNSNVNNSSNSGVTLKDATPQTGPDFVTLSTTISEGKINVNGRAVTNGTFDYVITNDGKVVLGTGHYNLSGGAETVKAAGQVKIYKGQVTTITNSSGHYKPSIAEGEAAVGMLKDAGINTTGANVKIYNGAGEVAKSYKAE